MSPKISDVQCIFCLASNSVPTGNAKCCCASCGRIFEVSKSTSGKSWAVNPNLNRTEPPVVSTPAPVNYRSAPEFHVAKFRGSKIPAWPWPALASRSEEGRHRFFSTSFRHLLLISVPMFAFMLTMAIGYEVGVLGMLIIAPLSFVSALAMGIGQTWIVDNAYREGKSVGLVRWTPFYLQFYMLTRWAICWRPLGMITIGGAFYVGLLFYMLGDQLGTSMPNSNVPTLANQALPQQVKPFDLRAQTSPARRSAPRKNTVAESWYNGVQTHPAPSAPPAAANETIWSYEDLTPSNDTPPQKNVEPSTDAKQVEVPSQPIQPILSPVFEEDDGFREWSNLTGSYKVIAKFDVVDGEFVQLKTREGRKIRVEISKLSAEDRRFLDPILQSSPFEVVGGR